MSRNDLPYSSVVSFLREHDHYVILTHDRPDGDTVGSGYALTYLLREIGKKAGMFFNPSAGSKLMPYFLDAGVDFPMDHATVITVDVADEKLLFDDEISLLDYVQLVIDHHHNNRVVPGIHLVDEQAAATCEIIYSLSEEIGISLPQKAAHGIYLGIMTDTGCFKYSNVTPETLRIASEALKYGATGSALSREWFIKKSKERMMLEADMISGLRYYEDGKICIGMMTYEHMQELQIKEEEVNGMASMTILAEGCEIGIFLKETEDHQTKVSVRTDLVCDAAELCSVFGGGGHVRAAGCSMNCPPEESAAIILEEAKKRL